MAKSLFEGKNKENENISSEISSNYIMIFFGNISLIFSQTLIISHENNYYYEKISYKKNSCLLSCAIIIVWN